MDFNALPTTTFVMFGAVLAAVLTGGFSFINMMLSKEAKISEARLAWNDDLRVDVSTMLANVETLTRLAEHELRKLNQFEFDDDQLWLFRDKHKEEYLAANEARHRILLRVNPEKHNKVKDAVEALFDLFRGKCGNAKAIYAAENTVATEAQEVLRRTWKKVKDGEEAYVSTKRVLHRGGYALLVLGAFIVAIFVFSVARTSSGPSPAPSSPPASSVPTK